MDEELRAKSCRRVQEVQEFKGFKNVDVNKRCRAVEGFKKFKKFKGSRVQEFKEFKKFIGYGLLNNSQLPLRSRRWLATPSAFSTLNWRIAPSILNFQRLIAKVAQR